MTKEKAIALICILMVSGAFFMIGLTFIGAMESTKIDDLGYNARDMVAFLLSLVMFSVSLVGIILVTLAVTVFAYKESQTNGKNIP